MADALDLGSSVQYVWVQVPHPAPEKTVNTLLTLGAKRHGASLLEGARGKVSLGSRYDLHLAVK